MKTDMTIGKLAETAGVGVETVRFYERKGLIVQPLKPLSGFRLYPTETLARLRFIRHAQELGFALKEISELLALRATPDAECGDVRDHAVDKLAAVNRKIDALSQIKTALTRVIEACPGTGDLTCCSIIEAMESTPMAEKTITITVNGMTCSGCEDRLTQVLAKDPGIRTVHASHSAKSATVTYTPTTLERTQIHDLIIQAGFTPN